MSGYKDKYTGREMFADARPVVSKDRLDVAERIIAELERELLDIKGPCSFAQCRLHYAHYGPCDTRKEASHDG